MKIFVVGNLRNLTLGRVGDGKSEERDDEQRFEVVSDDCAMHLWKWYL